MRTTVLAACTAALLAASAFAQDQGQAHDWVMDREASAVGFEATAFNTPLSGEFETFSAQIRLDPADLSDARIEAVVDTSSFVLSNSEYRSSLSGGSGLAVEAHPEARFVSDDIRAVDDGYEAVGALTIKGETNPLTLPFTLTIDGDRAVADGAFSLNRSAFGVGGGDWGDVGPSVTVTVHIEADRAEGSETNFYGG
ncbi:YceI family protein [Maricaulaceae bacterium MS644]